MADPNATVSGQSRAGLVRVVLGGGKGVSEISQATAGMNAAPEIGDEFGRSLATYDADADGCTDLVIGAPYEDVSKDGVELADAGAVYVVHGTAGGIGAGSVIDSYSQAGFDPATANEEYDWFGFALSAGKTSSGKPFLAVGVPGENVGSVADAGIVHYAQAATRMRVHQDSTGVPGIAEAHDRFGYSLSSTSGYLGVGAPGEAIGDETFAGGVTVFSHAVTDNVPTALAGLDQAGASEGLTGVAEAGDGFGTSISLAPYRPAGSTSNTDALLAIGVPNEDIGTVADAGSATVLHLTPTGTYTEISAIDRNVTDVEGDPIAGDFLGQRVVLTNTSPTVVGTATTMRLAAAAPGEDAGSVREAGAIHTFPALGAPGLSDKIIARGTGLPGTATARDFTGMGLATTATDLYVGAPYAKTSDEVKGAVYVVPWKNLVSGATDPVKTLKPGTDGLPDSGISFGAVIK
ncbi:integrin alpha [Streptomyces dioscori]|uniref:integrin alpha n=1 Tax=Streptomyces dioscori TaxID=2109333 RepID=UPI001CED9FD2|nr:integrin alpha [Streptomyces dioscori]